MSRFRRVGKTLDTSSSTSAVPPAAVGVTLLFDRLVHSVSLEKNSHTSSTVDVVCVANNAWHTLNHLLFHYTLRLAVSREGDNR